MTEKQRTAALANAAKLLAVAQEVHGKLGDIIAELDGILGGKAGIGAEMKQLASTFDRLWSERYARGEMGRYVWGGKKDNAQLKRLIKMLGLAEAERRVGAYIASDDDFFRKHRHSFGMFVSTINQHASTDRIEFSLDAPAPAGCKHTPPCKTDQEHTRRRRDELRA